MVFYDSQRDPVDNSIADTYHWQSTSSTGTSTTYFEDLTVPSSPNFPNSTAIRYMMNLPGEPYYQGVADGTHPFVLKNINSTVILTRVSPSGTLTANTYKIFPATANTPGRVEVHVGSSSVQAGDTLAYEGYFINNIISSSDVSNYMLYSSSGVVTSVYFEQKIFEIGPWDMDNFGSITIYDDNMPGSKARNAYVVIQDDTPDDYYPLNMYASGTVNGSVVDFSSTSISIARTSSGFFDNSNFSSTTINRGWLYILYQST